MLEARTLSLMVLNYTPSYFLVYKGLKGFEEGRV